MFHILSQFYIHITDLNYNLGGSLLSKILVDYRISSLLSAEIYCSFVLTMDLFLYVTSQSFGYLGFNITTNYFSGDYETFYCHGIIYGIYKFKNKIKKKKGELEQDAGVLGFSAGFVPGACQLVTSEKKWDPKDVTHTKFTVPHLLMT